MTALWLAIETATDLASVAIGSSERVVAEAMTAGGRQHARSLLPMIRASLEQAGIGLGGLAGVAVADGPGSFTGLRIGATVAAGLSDTLHLPLVTAPSLQVRARRVAADDGRLVLAVSDALRGDIYAAMYRFHPETIETVLVPGVYHPDQLMTTVQRPDRMVGDPPEVLTRVLEHWAGSPVVRSPAGAPLARDLLRLIGVRGGAAPVPDPRVWEPEYGRPAEAQARWEAAHGRRLPDPTGRPG